MPRPKSEQLALRIADDPTATLEQKVAAMRVLQDAERRRRKARLQPAPAAQEPAPEPALSTSPADIAGMKPAHERTVEEWNILKDANHPVWQTFLTEESTDWDLGFPACSEPGCNRGRGHGTHWIEDPTGEPLLDATGGPRLRTYEDGREPPTMVGRHVCLSCWERRQQ